MYEYITGNIAELVPTNAIIDNNGIGYDINISLYTYSFLTKGEKCKLLLQQIIREDAHVLFGFIDEKERSLFRQLISVSGVGANTARMMLSSLSPDEIVRAIISGNVATLKSIKGIGAKSAERIIVDLRDKVGRISDGSDFSFAQNNTIAEEALSALINLGFQRKAVEKIVHSILSEDESIKLEDLIKVALKRL